MSPEAYLVVVVVLCIVVPFLSSEFVWFLSIPRWIAPALTTRLVLSSFGCSG
jgi:hypothetical protein